MSYVYSHEICLYISTIRKKKLFPCKQSVISFVNLRLAYTYTYIHVHHTRMYTYVRTFIHSTSH